MKNVVAAGVVGFVFSLGLGLSGMTQPQKIIGFLDIFGHWDPSLMFVMIGAISIHFVSFKLIRKKGSPLFSSQWHLPTKKEITPALLSGSFIFGVGWGLGGYCPGPAVTSLATLDPRVGIFVVSMVAGMLLFRLMDKKLKLNK